VGRRCCPVIVPSCTAVYKTPEGLVSCHEPRGHRGWCKDLKGNPISGFRQTDDPLEESWDEGTRFTGYTYPCDQCGKPLRWLGAPDPHECSGEEGGGPKEQRTDRLCGIECHKEAGHSGMHEEKPNGTWWYNDADNVECEDCGEVYNAVRIHVCPKASLRCSAPVIVYKTPDADGELTLTMGSGTRYTFSAAPTPDTEDDMTDERTFLEFVRGLAPGPRTRGLTMALLLALACLASIMAAIWSPLWVPEGYVVEGRFTGGVAAAFFLVAFGFAHPDVK
jgi:hypothetical protein